MLFGLATLPLTKVCLQKLGAVQRRMLRSIGGRVAWRPAAYAIFDTHASFYNWVGSKSR